MTKILVVDTEKDVCDFTARFFGERNFEVFSATNGTDAIQAIKKNRPNIVLLDIKVKDMSGVGVLRHIQNINQKTKVIIVTSINDIEILKEAKKLGVVAYLTKPILLNELLDIVLKNLGKQRRFFELNMVPKNE